MTGLFLFAAGKTGDLDFDILRNLYVDLDFDILRNLYVQCVQFLQISLVVLVGASLEEHGFLRILVMAHHLIAI
jgi:hypothetical protein